MSLTVNDRAQRIATFRYVEVRLMEIVAAWTPTTPEMEVKVLFGRHIWDFAQHADWLGKRTFELRQPEHFTLTPVETYVQLLDEIAAATDTAGRLSALYDVLLPAIESRYRGYIRETDTLLDAPSVAIFERILQEIPRMREEAAQLGQELPAPAVSLDVIARRERAHDSILAARGNA